MFVVAPLVGLAGSTSAFVLANHHDLPPAQFTVALLCAALGLAWLQSRLRRRGARDDAPAAPA